MLEKPLHDAVLEENEIPNDPEFDQYWLDVVKQRIENVKTGKSRTVPLQEVLDELERRLQKSQ